jgi:hypothetical protein
MRLIGADFVRIFPTAFGREKMYTDRWGKEMNFDSRRGTKDERFVLTRFIYCVRVRTKAAIRKSDPC